MSFDREWVVVEHGGVAHAVNGFGPGFVYHTFCGLTLSVTRPYCRNCGDTKCKVCRRLSRRRLKISPSPVAAGTR